MAVLADSRICFFDPLQIRLDGPRYASSGRARYGSRRFNLVKISSIAPFTPSLQSTGKFSAFQKQRRMCPLVLDSADFKKSSEPPQASRLLGEVTTQDDKIDESQNGSSSLHQDSKLLSTSEVAAFRSDPVRSKLIKKLSEANQFNRHLLRQVAIREKVIQQSKAQISDLELELGILVKIAQEIAKDGGKPGTRKINGRYIHSHLAVRLEECVCALLSQLQSWGGDDNLLTTSTTFLASEAPELQQTLLKQLETIEGVRSREVECVYYGMAENVVVMGSFDSWSHGEAMSPEMTGTFTKFSATLKLLPGRYEIKFMVDGEWRLSNFLPIIGEGLMMNNLLVVD
ncbi:hypothetical protein MPTK1_7g03320 [Marchantia polymorpha subsp. ruderalis]|uniref:AMP-activated protein kinase glycogen-binding domain-containing protein n=3 Tax=Marchantia polymorpha TaxID=3197 RepID=A0AAF6BVP9_MARPO|nr:hypothetical protein MARPO_0074s0064 [Marchantia polymorpha]BBN16083.1 hypothetical protein Mp_7g03320 [Marchantia polymorpha subsp. ruderalis]|eukprot:PTQ35082.1 hypothetical protein MARPO_0074s0064 [Marchantia polymorpha]